MTYEERKLDYQRLQELTHSNLMRLIDSELSLALTMSELAETEAELGDEAHAKGLLEKVQRALDAVRQHVGDHQLSENENREIEARVQELTKVLHAAKQEVFE